ncbi:hypothetical protein SPRG_12752 [Saprolegnia parasitica CBS 223.65]|uniref:Uncharacterized protein n=1 Tax=Saprolegnia parasitica (strain CBS 223.65) TaxID=695850 RepID=A0A067BV96_SAPPC|nr:hypothetical protein SPRG_12752 [Saprolegnia parasitica CBS 223.65]KDO22469.1 hypothetical protein SPRG_12752 [Saprolegnia parasitica CBS 223.65]|eukprot:XP_012206856.1 hypothetical protein SPRG_12752 [Saprolegnia parasitica CBS 223.65]
MTSRASDVAAWGARHQALAQERLVLFEQLANRSRDQAARIETLTAEVSALEQQLASCVPPFVPPSPPPLSLVPLSLARHNTSHPTDAMPLCLDTTHLAEDVIASSLVVAGIGFLVAALQRHRRPPPAAVARELCHRERHRHCIQLRLQHSALHIFNRSRVDLDLTGCVVQTRDDLDGYVLRFAFPSGFLLAAATSVGLCYGDAYFQRRSKGAPLDSRTSAWLQWTTRDTWLAAAQAISLWDAQEHCIAELNLTPRL